VGEKRKLSLGDSREKITLARLSRARVKQKKLRNYLRFKNKKGGDKPRPSIRPETSGINENNIR